MSVLVICSLTEIFKVYITRPEHTNNNIFAGVVGLAYLADPGKNHLTSEIVTIAFTIIIGGQFAGGICQTRTRTSKGDLK